MNISKFISEANGELAAEYTPTPKSSDLIFVDWYYTDPGTGEEKPFIRSAGIQESMAESVDPGTSSDGKTTYVGILRLYPKWIDPNAAETKTVTVRHFPLDEFGNKYLDENGELLDPSKPLPADWDEEWIRGTQEQIEIGQTYVGRASNDIEGYYPDSMFQTITVSRRDASNVITFYYRPVTAWKYNVEYYVRLKPLDSTAKVGSVNLTTATKDFFIGKIEEPYEAFHRYEGVPITYNEEFLAGYQDYYRVCGYQYADNDYVDYESNALTILVPDDTSKIPTLKIYLELDTTRLELNDLSEIYNGKNHVSTDLQRQFEIPVHPDTDDDPENGISAWYVSNLYKYYAERHVRWCERWEKFLPTRLC